MVGAAHDLLSQLPSGPCTPAFDIHVQTGYPADQSAPEREVFAFSYTITINIRCDAPAQLIARHWY